MHFGDLFVFNVYMPCDQHTFIDSYIEVLSEISQYCLSHNVHYFIIAGDLNTDNDNDKFYSQNIKTPFGE